MDEFLKFLKRIWITIACAVVPLYAYTVISNFWISITITVIWILTGTLIAADDEVGD